MSEVVYDVAIVGAGLAGISAGIHCGDVGLSTVLIEASDEIGGKLRTDFDAEGFVYDRGFQVLFTGYDEVKKLGDGSYIPETSWRFYSPGATIAGMGTLSKWNPVRSLKCSAIRPIDLPKLLLLNLRSRNWEAETGSKTVREFLAEFGFSSIAIDRFFSPFYGGISLDRSLSGSARQFLKTWHFLSLGKTATLGGGIAELPFAIDFAWCFDDPNGGLQLERRQLVDSLTCGEEHLTVSATGAFKARSVILACGPTAASRLTGHTMPAKFKQSICLYFASDRSVTEEKFIVLNPATDAFVNQLVPLSNVNPGCAPKGKHLCSATIIGERPESDEELARVAIKEMNTWGMNLPPLEFKRAYRIKEAQLQQEPGFEDRVPSIDTHLPGVFLAGEMTTSSSINDALKSGRLAAEAALAYLRNK